MITTHAKTAILFSFLFVVWTGYGFAGFQGEFSPSEELPSLHSKAKESKSERLKQLAEERAKNASQPSLPSGTVIDV